MNPLAAEFKPSMQVLKDSEKERARWLNRTIQKLGPVNKTAFPHIVELTNYFMKVQKYDEALLYLENLEKFCNPNTYLLYRTKQNMGKCYGHINKQDAAIQKYLECLEIAPHIANPSLIPQTYNNLGNSYLFSGLINEALMHYQGAAKYPVHDVFSMARLWNNMGNCYKMVSRFQQSLEYYLLALGIRAQHNAQQDLFHSLINVSKCFRYLGDYQQALEYSYQAQLLGIKIYGENDPRIVGALRNAGMCLYLIGRYQEALETFNQALSLLGTSVGENHHSTMSLRNNLGMCHLKLGHYKESLEEHQKALKTENQLFLTNPFADSENLPIRSTQAKYRSFQGEALFMLGKYHEAILIFKQTLIEMEKVFEDEHDSIARSLDGLAECYYSIGKYHKALQSYIRAMEIKQKVFTEGHENFAHSLTGIGNCFALLGETQQALEFHLEALKIHTEHLGPEHPTCAMIQMNIGSCLSLRQDYQGALERYREAHELRKKKLGQTHPQTHFAGQLVTICENRLKGHFDRNENQVEKIDKKHFIDLIKEAIKHLEKDPKNCQFEINPSGFLRLRGLTAPESMADKVESVRLHYWPKSSRYDIVEALHTHPSPFASLMIHGKYIHRVCSFQPSPSTTSRYNTYRIIKANQERNIFYMGSTQLTLVREEEVTTNCTAYFPTNLIHQVLTTEPGTLTVNYVLKDGSRSYFDVHIEDRQGIDPVVGREILETTEAENVAAEIRKVLQNYLNQAGKSDVVLSE